VKDGQHILIENCAGLGDLIMFTPALRKLKELYPNCVISFITKPGNRAMLERLPYIDHQYFIKRGAPLGRIRPAGHLLGQDYVIFTRWQPQMAFLTYLMRIPHRIGLYQEKYAKTNLFHKTFKKWVLDTPNFAADTIAKTLGMALDCDLDINRQCDVSRANNQEKEKMQALLQSMGKASGQKYVVLAPFTSREERDLPAALVVKIAKHIADKYGYAVVLIGTAEYASSIPSDANIYNLCGKTNLYEVLALLEDAAFVVASDSGPMHMACALGVKTVAVFSKDLPQRWAPRELCYPVSLYMHCSPCGDETAEACPTKECIKGITLDMIIEQMENLLQGKAPHFSIKKDVNHAN
jgi:ADP-heptose:LPS heptosyltransferase